MTAAPEFFTTRYRVLGQLGEGAMGVVYRVKDRLHGGAERALKVVKPQGPDPTESLLRFKAEFHAMARLSHPNTTRVLDYGELADGTLFLVMELVPGQELSDLIAGRPMALDTVYPLLTQLLQALDFIHARHYLHRDIKAANVRVRPDGVLKLMDFGLMGHRDQVSSKAASGTPAYMAPEIPQGGAISAATDLYAVGCLAYEMLTGNVPFTGSLGEVVRGHLREPPPSLATRRPDAPRALVRLIERMLEKDPSRRPRHAGQVLAELAPITGVRQVRESLDQQRSFLASSAIVGRANELARLDAALEAAREGRGCSLMLRAPAGTGKSRLVQELKLRAQLAGFIVMHGQCHDEGMGPYEALREGLRPALAHGTPEERERYGEALAALFPEYVGRPAPQTPTTIEPVLAWLEGLSQRHPLLLVMDDMHWADPQTVDVVNLGIRRFAHQPFLTVCTFRDDEIPAGSPVWQTLEDGTSEALALQPLSREEQDALLTSLLPDALVPPAFSDALHQATGGNPLFVQEALHMLLEEGFLSRRQGQWHFPTDVGVLRDVSRVERTIQRRLAHLSPGALDVLQRASVLGHHWTLATLAALVEQAEADLFEAIEELTERQFLDRDATGGYHFPHDRVREVTYAATEPGRRAALHLRAGEVLAARAAERPDAMAHELARHFFLGGDDARAWPWLTRAAQVAIRAGASYVAMVHLRDADAALARLPGDHLAERLPLWVLSGQHGFHMATGLAAQALAHLAAAHDREPSRVENLLSELGVTIPEILMLHGVTHGLIGETATGLRSAAKVATLVPSSGSIDSALPVLAGISARLVGGRIDGLIRDLEDTEPLFDRDLPRDTSPILYAARVGFFAAQNARAFQGIRPDPGPRDRALAYARELGDEDPYLAWFYFGLWNAWTGHTDAFDAYVERTVAQTRRIGGPPQAWLLYLRPYVRWQQGDFAPALERLERNLIAYPHLREHAMVFELALTLRGHLLADLGRVEEANSVFDEVVRVAREKDHGIALMLGLYGQGATRAAGGRPREALPYFEELHALSLGAELRNPLSEAYGLFGLGVCEARLQDPRGLTRLADALAIARRPEMDNLFLQAHLQRVRGSVLASFGQREEAIKALGEAGQLFHRMRNAHWLHSVHLELARAQQAPEPPAQAAPGENLEARYERFRRLI